MFKRSYFPDITPG